jgi:PHD/YefM family antitoxin component YafN of YafNO toxin-antitoxin module
MIPIRERYITDEKGKKTAVVIDIEDYKRIKKILKEHEEYDTMNVNEDIARALVDVEKQQLKSVDEVFGDMQ